MSTGRNKLTRDRIERIRDGGTYTLEEHTALCEMVLRAAAEPEAKAVRCKHLRCDAGSGACLDCGAPDLIARSTCTYCGYLKTSGYCQRSHP